MPVPARRGTDRTPGGAAERSPGRRVEKNRSCSRTSRPGAPASRRSAEASSPTAGTPAAGTCRPRYGRPAAPTRRPGGRSTGPRKPAIGRDGRSRWRLARRVRPVRMTARRAATAGRGATTGTAAPPARSRGRSPEPSRGPSPEPSPGRSPEPRPHPGPSRAPKRSPAAAVVIAGAIRRRRNRVAALGVAGEIVGGGEREWWRRPAPLSRGRTQ